MGGQEDQATVFIIDFMDHHVFEQIKFYAAQSAFVEISCECQVFQITPH